VHGRVPLLLVEDPLEQVATCANSLKRVRAFGAQLTLLMNSLVRESAFRAKLTLLVMQAIATLAAPTMVFLSSTLLSNEVTVFA